MTTHKLQARIDKLFAPVPPEQAKKAQALKKIVQSPTGQKLKLFIRAEMEKHIPAGSGTWIRGATIRHKFVDDMKRNLPSTISPGLREVMDAILDEVNIDIMRDTFGPVRVV